MEEYKSISLIPYKNWYARIFALFGIFVFVSSMIFMFQELKDNHSPHYFDQFSNTSFLLIAGNIVVYISIYWSYKLAKKTNRDITLWILLSIFIGPIAFLILSFKDHYIENPELAEIVIQTRKEFNSEIQNIKKEIDKEMKISDLTSKYEKILKERASKVITKKKIETIKELVDIGILDKDIDLIQKEHIILETEQYKTLDKDLENWDSNWQEDETKCPACGVSLNPQSNNCLNCGLKVK